MSLVLGYLLTYVRIACNQLVNFDFAHPWTEIHNSFAIFLIDCKLSTVSTWFKGIILVPTRNRNTKMGEMVPESSHLVTVDDLIRTCAEDADGKPLLAFPKKRTGSDGPWSFELFSGKDLDRFAEGAAREYLQRGLRVAVCCSGFLEDLVMSAF